MLMLNLFEKEVPAMLGQKLVALLIMAVPAIIAVYGIKVMRDVI